MEITAYENVFMKKAAPFCLFYGNGYFFMEIGFNLWKLVVTFIEFRCISDCLPLLSFSIKLVCVYFMEFSCRFYGN